MTTTPENIIDVMAEHAIEGMMLRLQWMTLTPKSICVLGSQREQLLAKLKACYPEADIGGENPDIIIANLELPWHSDMAAVIKAWRAFLQPQGMLMFTSFGPDTLREWPDQNACLVNRIDMHDVGDTLVHAGLADPVMEVENYIISYSDSEKMQRELVAGKLLIDANGMLPEPQDAKWQITCELVYGHAWKVGDEVKADDDGVVKVPLKMLRAQLRGRD